MLAPTCAAGCLAHACEPAHVDGHAADSRRHRAHAHDREAGRVGSRACTPASDAHAQTELGAGVVVAAGGAAHGRARAMCVPHCMASPPRWRWGGAGPQALQSALLLLLLLSLLSWNCGVVAIAGAAAAVVLERTQTAPCWQAHGQMAPLQQAQARHGQATDVATHAQPLAVGQLPARVLLSTLQRAQEPEGRGQGRQLQDQQDQQLQQQIHEQLQEQQLQQQQQQQQTRHMQQHTQPEQMSRRGHAALVDAAKWAMQPLGGLSSDAASEALAEAVAALQRCVRRPLPGAHGAPAAAKARSVLRPEQQRSSARGGYWLGGGQPGTARRVGRQAEMLGALGEGLRLDYA
eukprot:364840-Chlamydomonas_euryale.AAC.6